MSSSTLEIRLNRRQFLRAGTLGVAASSLCSFPYVGRVLGASEKINVACIGVGGKGNSDSDHAAQCGHNLVALCDVVETNLARKAAKYPAAKCFRDYRKLLEELDKSIDAVIVSTPDHHHGLAATLAMSLGKHVYCQKPLAQTIHEVRQMRQLAAEKKLATQLGNQGSASNSLRRAVEVVQAGILGPVLEAHVWSNRPMWPAGIERPAGEDPVPPGLDWNLWLGPASRRPFKTGTYLPGRWRGWHDFGTGALGDMGCHTLNMPFRALKLGYPSVVECEAASCIGPETYPKTSRLRFEFPERDGLPQVKLWWYDGNPKESSMAPLRPYPDLVKDILEPFDSLAPSGILLLGQKGRLYSPDEGGGRFYLKLNGESEYVAGPNHPAARAIPLTLPRAPEGVESKDSPEEGRRNVTKMIDYWIGEDLWQKGEWFRMIREGNPTYSNFAFAALLTECLLLGNLAIRLGVGRKCEWDAPKMQSPNCPDAARFIKRENRVF